MTFPVDHLAPNHSPLTQPSHNLSQYFFVPLDFKHEWSHSFLAQFQRNQISIGLEEFLFTCRSSALTDGAWEGRLVHLSGVDVLGATAGSLSRLMQDREQELWEGRRLVASADEGEVRF